MFGLSLILLGALVGAWLGGRMTQRTARAALPPAAGLRHAIESGQQRPLEEELRRNLALAAAGQGVSPEREWLWRAQLAGLLVAEWRLEEAEALYSADSSRLATYLQPLAAYGRHELAVLQTTPDDARLQQIRIDRAATAPMLPPGGIRDEIMRSWIALEGLCLIRMGRAREGIAMVEQGLPALDYNPARVVYLYYLGRAHEAIGDHTQAASCFERAMLAFPGTRLANDARARLSGLDGHSGFRGYADDPTDEVP